MMWMRISGYPDSGKHLQARGAVIFLAKFQPPTSQNVALRAKHPKNPDVKIHISGYPNSLKHPHPRGDHSYQVSAS